MERIVAERHGSGLRKIGVHPHDPRHPRPMNYGRQMASPYTRLKTDLRRAPTATEHLATHRSNNGSTGAAAPEASIGVFNSAAVQSTWLTCAE
jgi:hypothetical protein